MTLLHVNGLAGIDWIRVMLAVAALLVPASGLAQLTPLAQARAQVVALAQAGKIADIETAMQSAQADFERDQKNTERMGGMLDGIEDKRLPFYHIEAQLNQWVERAPQSYAARLLRGSYLGAAAGRARGQEWARLTSEEQFANMRDLHQRSNVDLLAACDLTRVPLHARVRLMWNSLVGSQRALLREQYELALAQSPGNVRLRRAWMATLEPRWGGNYEAMARYAAESAAALAPAQSAEFKSAVLFDAAAMLNSSSQFEAAANKYGEAIRVADFSRLHAARAYPLARLARDQEALDDLQIAFKDPDFFRSLAAAVLTILGRRNQPLPGVHDLIDAVLEHHPDEADLRNLRGFRLQQSGDRKRAYEDFRAAAETDDAWAETMVGKYIFNGFGGLSVNQEEGLAWIKRAALKGDRNAQLSVTQALEAMGRQSEIAAAKAEIQQANQKIADKGRARDASDALADPKQFLLRKAAELWVEYNIYIILYGLVLALVFSVLLRRRNNTK